MTFKDYANANSHLPLGTIRANWGKIQKALQSNLSERYGACKDTATFKLAGKVNKDGYVKISAVRAVRATDSEIRAQRAKDADSAAKHDARLAELESFAKQDGFKGLDLVDLVKAKTAVESAPEPATAPVVS